MTKGNPIPTPQPGRAKQQNIQPFVPGMGLASGVNQRVKGASPLPAKIGAPRAPASNAGNGHTTSGLDRAMQAHADKLHPIKGATRAPATQSPDMD